MAKTFLKWQFVVTITLQLQWRLMGRHKISNQQKEVKKKRKKKRKKKEKIGKGP